MLVSLASTHPLFFMASFGDFVGDGIASMHAQEDDGSKAKIVEILRTLDKRLHDLEADSEDNAPQDKIRRKELQEHTAKRIRGLVATSAPDTASVPLSEFRRPRIMCMSMTLIYFISWVCVLSTGSWPLQTTQCDIDAWVTGNYTEFAAWSTKYRSFNEVRTAVSSAHPLSPPFALLNAAMASWQWVSVIEFMWTGITETATIADLLLTLPSAEGGAWAVAHFIVYEAIFLSGTAALYTLLCNPATVAAYATIHVVKATVAGFLFFMARRRLYQRAQTQQRRYEQAATYFGSLLKIGGVQFTLFLALVAVFATECHREGGTCSPPSAERLLAATTLSVALPQSFMLILCIKGASRLTPESVAKLKLTCFQACALAGIAAFAISGCIAYFLAVEGGTILDRASAGIGRAVYYTSNIVYGIALMLVSVEIYFAGAGSSDHSKERPAPAPLSERHSSATAHKA